MLKTKIMKKLFTPILLILLVFQSCEEASRDVSNLQPKSIVELVTSVPELSSLAAALGQADLISTLNGTGPFTILAPNNDAFNAFLVANNFASLNDVPTSILKEVLLNHVISGNLQSTDLSTGYASTLATSAASGTNMSIFIDTSNGVRFNGVSSVTNPNVQTTNGTVHIVDAVIGLPSVVDFALADPNFSILVQALTRSDLQTNFVGILSTSNGTTPAPFTVFAPINQAFVDVLAELKLSALADINEPTLSSILTYHVVGGLNVRAGALTDNFTVPTLGGNITANITGGAKLTDTNSRVSDIIATDVQANNGVIHAIRKVILP